MPKPPSFSAIITIDIDHKKNNTYDVYMSTENSSGENYNNISAEQIGQYVADMITSLETEYTKKDV